MLEQIPFKQISQKQRCEMLSDTEKSMRKDIMISYNLRKTNVRSLIR